MTQRLNILKQHGLGLNDIQEVIAEMGPLPGAKEFVEWVSNHFQLVILSDTFYEFAHPLMKQLGWPTIFCHKLETDENGMITAYKLRQPDQKRESVKALHGLNFRVIAQEIHIMTQPCLVKLIMASYLMHLPTSLRNSHSSQQLMDMMP